ncbi:AgmX/PglI C-terminal domain-containing protein [candidate division WOR-3 bacterium]|nr:AgmX/PglI C-terminal domain-containing protein [candidate division WOR-3 bacterium]
MTNLTKLMPVLGMVLAGLATAQPAEAPDEDKTLSPYFFVQSDDPSVDKLPLLKTEAAVDIAGVIADVKVTQVYKNDGKRPIEAIYTFPASTRAAVYAMKMTIGDRTIVARIKEREKARADYEAARKQGKSASLLEQQRPNVFQMNVANIMPGDYIRVEMSYTELLVPEAGVYEFAYPTVVGPRYNGKAGAESHKSEKWIASPYTHEGEAPTYEFGMAVNIAAGMPLQDVSCPTHKTIAAYKGLNEASVRLDPSEKAGGNRDFILRYRLAGGRIQSGLLLYPGKDEQFFLLMLQPPKRVELAQIPPREYIFIMDVSGSMHGHPIDISKKLMRNLLSNMRPKDCFNILFFAGGNFVLSEKSLSATKKNVEDALSTIDKQMGGGGTELLSALRRALALPRAEGTSRTVVIATDGYVTVETEAFDLIRDNLDKANMFAFGIGSSVNRFIIEGMAHVGMGEPFIVEKPERAEAQTEKFRQYIETPVLTGIDIDFPGFDAYDVEPKTIPDVMAERPIVVFGKYRGKASGAITVRGWSGSGKYSEAVKVADFSPDVSSAALRYLWARHRIQLLADYNNLFEDSSRIKEVTRLGLKYNLLTRYTSFVAIDQKVRNVGGKQEVVEQPLPMPEGVSDYAVGGGASFGYAGACKAAAPMAQTVVSRRSAGELSRDGAWYSPPPPSVPSVSPATVQVGKLQVSGGLSQKSVKETIEKKLAEVRAAYLAELGSDPTLKGKLVIEFTIKPDGTVYNALSFLNELNSTLERKVLDVIRKLRFSQPTAGEATVTVTFGFTT